MKRSSRWPLVLLTLLFGNPAAIVAADDNMPKSGASSSAATASQAAPKDTLSLSDSERSIVQQDISQYATKATAPPGFTAEVGAVVPKELATFPVPVSTASKVPALRLYEYAMLDNNQLLIIDSRSNKVVEVIAR
jgi:hypothetical protein